MRRKNEEKATGFARQTLSPEDFAANTRFADAVHFARAVLAEFTSAKTSVTALGTIGRAAFGRE